MQYSTSTTKLWDSDVLVIGSGASGATAAITAAQQGAKVTLVERYGFMGGISTQVLDTFYGFYTPGSEARKVVGGVPDQVVNALIKRKRAIFRPNTYGAGQGITYDPQALKIIWETLAKLPEYVCFITPLLSIRWSSMGGCMASFGEQGRLL